MLGEWLVRLTLSLWLIVVFIGSLDFGIKFLCGIAFCFPHFGPCVATKSYILASGHDVLLNQKVDVFNWVFQFLISVPTMVSSLWRFLTGFSLYNWRIRKVWGFFFLLWGSVELIIPAMGFPFSCSFGVYSTGFLVSYLISGTKGQKGVSYHWILLFSGCSTSCFCTCLKNGLDASSTLVCTRHCID